jgi:hypothetical protein
MEGALRLLQHERAGKELTALRPAPPFSSSQTLFGHGVYLAAVALSLFLVPGIVRSLLALPAEADWWSRLLAIPLFNLGILCIGVARTHSRPLIKLAVAMRLWVMVTVAILVAARLAPVVALTVGVIDLLSAALTTWALVAEKRSPA